MADRFDKFTERARKVLQLAQEEAQRFNHNYIGTEHLLLGLVREGEGVAAKVLANLGVELNKVRSAVEFIIGRGDRTVAGDIGLTPRAKKVIELSVDEARRLNHHIIGTEHLLLGLVREGEGIAAGVLESLGVSLDKVRSQVIYVLNQPAAYSQSAASKTPVIDQLGVNLTAAARAGKLDPIIVHSREIEHTVSVLSRLTRNNPVLIAEPSQGLRRIVEGLVMRIATGEVPETLMRKQVVEIDFDSLLVAPGTRAKSSPPQRNLMTTIVAEATVAGNYVFFLHDVPRFVLTRARQTAPVISPLRAALVRGDIHILGTATRADFRKYIERDAILAPRFEPVLVEEPSIEETIEILKGIKERYEQHHRLEISDEAITAAAELGVRYLRDRFMPDKAIDLVDEAASHVRMQRASVPPMLKEVMRSLESAQNEKESAIAAKQYELAAEYRDREAQLRAELEDLEQGWQAQDKETPVVTPDDIAQVVALWASIPITQIEGPESSRRVITGMRLESNRSVEVDRHHEPIEVFLSYSHRDEALRRVLEDHLALLRRQGIISIWHDRRISAGTEWAGQIDEHLDTAGVILLLVSAAFVASNYCYDKEMTRALQRHEDGEARVIPIILRPVDWTGAPFAKLQALPRDGRPITTWSNRDEAWRDVAQGIREAVSSLRLRP